MRTNKVILASLLVTGIAGKASSFYKFTEAYDLYDNGGSKSIEKVSKLCEGRRSFGGIYGDKEYCIPGRASFCTLGSVIIEKNTGTCLFVKADPSTGMIMGCNNEIALSQLFLYLKGPFENIPNKSYKWDIYTDTRLKNIQMVKLDDKDMDPSVNLIKKILDSKGDSLDFKQVLTDDDTGLTISNTKEGGVNLLNKKGEIIEFQELLLHLLEGDSKTLLANSDILSVWSINKENTSKEIYVGLAQSKDGSEVFHWATEIDTNSEKFKEVIKE